MSKLTSIAVRNATRPGIYGDGRGLSLIVRDGGARIWSLRVKMPNGERRNFKIGNATIIGLADAREKAAQWRALAKEGIDPIATNEREALASAREAERAATTFEMAARQFIAENETVWKNAKHRQQWRNTLEQYVYPSIGRVPVADVRVRDVIDLLYPIWLLKPETARRVLQRICNILDYAAAKDWRDDGVSKGAIEKGLPRVKRKANHFAAVQYENAHAVVSALRNSPETMGRLALEFTILTACRSGEVRGARWNEVDLQRKLWTVPADRMKAGVEHVVPLSAQAIALLDAMAVTKSHDDSLIFPGLGGSALSDMTMGKAQKLIAPNTTVHGWRATFRTWVADKTSFTRDIAEKALAHTLDSKVEASYNRGDLLEKRRVLMQAWADYLDGQCAEIFDLDAARVATKLAG